jgi:hypothetical protein
MGATEFSHRFNHYDYKKGIRELQQEATAMYGHNEGYSGEINCCSNFTLRTPSTPVKSEKQLWAYVEKRLDVLEKGEGEVIDLGVTEYLIAKPVVSDYHESVAVFAHVLKNLNKPAVLINERGLVISNGTLADLKKQAKLRVLKERFDCDYYIIGKTMKTVYFVTGESTTVKSTSKRSDTSQLVLPMHNYVVYGIAPS